MRGTIGEGWGVGLPRIKYYQVLIKGAGYGSGVDFSCPFPSPLIYINIAHYHFGLLTAFGIGRAAVAMFGKFAITSSFCIVYLHACEIIPTPVR